MQPEWCPEAPADVMYRSIYTAFLFIYFKTLLGGPACTLAENFTYMIKSAILYSAMAGGLLFTMSGCTKAGDDSSDIIGNWVSASYFGGNARSEAVSFTIGDKAYLTTGCTNRDRFVDLWEYDLDKKYWTKKANFPGVARNSAVAFSIGGKGYVGTGYDGTNYLKDFWEYDPATDTWTQKADFGGTGRFDAVGFSLNGSGYICAGYDGNYLGDLWQYIPGATSADPGSWVQRASIGGYKRTAASVFVLNNKAYVVSGNNNGIALDDMWAYDQTTDSWTEKRRIINFSTESYDDNYSGLSRYNASAFVMGGLAYLTLGESSGQTATTWEYNDQTDQWTQKTSFEGSIRTGTVAFTLKDRGFVLTGRNGTLSSTVSYDNMFEFHPKEEQVDND